MDQSLADLVVAGTVDAEEAFEKSLDKDQFKGLLEKRATRAAARPAPRLRPRAERRSPRARTARSARRRGRPTARPRRPAVERGDLRHEGEPEPRSALLRRSERDEELRVRPPARRRRRCPRSGRGWSRPAALPRHPDRTTRPPPGSAASRAFRTRFTSARRRSAASTTALARTCPHWSSWTAGERLPLLAEDLATSSPRSTGRRSLSGRAKKRKSPVTRTTCSASALIAGEVPRAGLARPAPRRRAARIRGSSGSRSGTRARFRRTSRRGPPSCRRAASSSRAASRPSGPRGRRAPRGCCPAASTTGTAVTARRRPAVESPRIASAARVGAPERASATAFTRTGQSDEPLGGGSAEASRARSSARRRARSPRRGCPFAADDEEAAGVGSDQRLRRDGEGVRALLLTPAESLQLRRPVAELLDRPREGGDRLVRSGSRAVAPRDERLGAARRLGEGVHRAGEPTEGGKDEDDQERHARRDDDGEDPDRPLGGEQGRRVVDGAEDPVRVRDATATTGPSVLLEADHASRAPARALVGAEPVRHARRVGKVRGVLEEHAGGVEERHLLGAELPEESDRPGSPVSVPRDSPEASTRAATARTSATSLSSLWSTAHRVVTFRSTSAAPARKKTNSRPPTTNRRTSRSRGPGAAVTGGGPARGPRGRPSGGRARRRPIRRPRGPARGEEDAERNVDAREEDEKALGDRVGAERRERERNRPPPPRRRAGRTTTPRRLRPGGAPAGRTRPPDGRPGRRPRGCTPEARFPGSPASGRLPRGPCRRWRRGGRAAAPRARARLADAWAARKARRQRTLRTRAGRPAATTPATEATKSARSTPAGPTKAPPIAIILTSPSPIPSAPRTSR